MTTETFNLIKLVASEGAFLTSKKVGEDGYRYFFTEAYLGINDSADNYEEWSVAEKEAWEAEWEAKKVEQVNDDNNDEIAGSAEEV